MLERTHHITECWQVEVLRVVVDEFHDVETIVEVPEDDQMHSC